MSYDYCPVCGPDFIPALDDCCDGILSSGELPHPGVREIPDVWSVDVSEFASAVSDGFDILFTWEDKDDDLHLR